MNTPMMANVPSSTYDPAFHPETFLQHAELVLSQRGEYLTPHEQNQALGAMWRIRQADLENTPVAYQQADHESRVNIARDAALSYPEDSVGAVWPTGDRERGSLFRPVRDKYNSSALTRTFDVPAVLPQNAEPRASSSAAVRPSALRRTWAAAAARGHRFLRSLRS
jgi:hypothetical protein